MEDICFHKGEAINTPEEGSILWNVNLDGGLFGVNVYADESDDAIDMAFDWAAENAPEMLDDQSAQSYIEEFKSMNPMPCSGAVDEFWEGLNEIFYSGGIHATHYTFRENFSIRKY